MVLQVGDKVLVYGAGTPWAYAKKIEPVQVGDTVDVVTLSDGTKLAMPKIELDLSEYVWVIPQWDNGFNLGDLPFGWGLMPLGAAVFTLSSVTCHTATDDLRVWTPGELSGFFLIPLRKPNLGALEIVGNTETKYDISTDGAWIAPWSYIGYDDISWSVSSESTPLVHIFEDRAVYVYRTGVVYKSGKVTLNQVKQIKIKFKMNSGGFIQGVNIYLEIVVNSLDIASAFKSTYVIRSPNYTYTYGAVDGLKCYPVIMRLPHSGDDGIIVKDIAVPEGYERRVVNDNYPNYTELTLAFQSPFSFGECDLNIICQYNNMNLPTPNFHGLEFDIESVKFFDDTFTEITDPCHWAIAGDKYIIYNPVTKRLVFNDATKLLTSANWQTGGEGSEISSSSVEYVWDGQGYVYLTSSKTTLSTIQFDDLLQVQAVHGETVRTIAYHLGERIAVSGETVSRELTNITRILRAGKNTITLTAKNQDGTKVGFVTAVYVKRNMTAVSL